MTTPLLDPADARVVPDWELADRLRRSMRLVRGMTNIDIAELLGVKRATISTWLNARRTPPKTTVMIWADLTGVDRQWLETGVPSDEWYAIRDSNPEPADFLRVLLALVLAALLPEEADLRADQAPVERLAAMYAFPQAGVSPRFTPEWRAS